MPKEQKERNNKIEWVKALGNPIAIILVALLGLIPFFLNRALTTKHFEVIGNVYYDKTELKKANNLLVCIRELNVECTTLKDGTFKFKGILKNDVYNSYTVQVLYPNKDTIFNKVVKSVVYNSKLLVLLENINLNIPIADERNSLKSTKRELKNKTFNGIITNRNNEKLELEYNVIIEGLESQKIITNSLGEFTYQVRDKEFNEMRLVTVFNANKQIIYRDYHYLGRNISITL